MPIAELPDLRLHYELSGPANAPVILFSNSLGTDLAMWAPQVERLGNRFRLLRYDSRGQNGSSLGGEEYTIELLARDAFELVKYLGLARVYFCGLSMGGMVGMWLALHAAECLNGLVLANTAPRIGTNETWNARIEAVRRGGMKAVSGMVVERWFTPEFRRASPDRVAWAENMLENSPPEGYARSCAAIRDMDQRQAVTRIELPTLVIAGAKDLSTPPAEGRLLAEEISHTQYVELAAAHLSNIEQEERFTEVLAGFVASQEKTHG